MAGEIPVADTTLDRFAASTGQEQTRLVNTAIDRLPKTLVAHRLGDFVFTYHGMYFRRADPNLWIVIASPDPQASPDHAATEITAGLLDGTTVTFSANYLPPKLAEQNILRALNNLAPLPDPATVTHDQPAPVIAEQDNP